MKQRVYYFTLVVLTFVGSIGILRAEDVYYTFRSDLILRSGAEANEKIEGWFALDVGAPLIGSNKLTLSAAHLRHNGEVLEIVDSWVSQRDPTASYENYPTVFQSVRIVAENDRRGLWLRFGFPVDRDGASADVVSDLTLPALNQGKGEEETGGAPDEDNVVYNGRFVSGEGAIVERAVPKLTLTREPDVKIEIGVPIPGEVQLQGSSDLKDWTAVGEPFFIEGDKSVLLEDLKGISENRFFRALATFDGNAAKRQDSP